MNVWYKIVGKIVYVNAYAPSEFIQWAQNISTIYGYTLIYTLEGV